MDGKDTNHDEHELDKIRMKKMAALIEAKKRQEGAQERSVSVWEKIDYVLKVVLAPNAYAHLNKLKSNEPQVYQNIFNELVSPEVIQNVDYLLAIIQKSGGVSRRIPLDAIIFLERKVKGIKSKIKVKRGSGEIMDLGSFLTKE